MQFGSVPTEGGSFSCACQDSSRQFYRRKAPIWRLTGFAESVISYVLNKAGGNSAYKVITFEILMVIENSV